MTTEDIKEAAAKHRMHTTKYAQSAKTASERKARRHTITDIKFSPAPFVVCSCEWRYYGNDTEAAWKQHKADVGEKHT